MRRHDFITPPGSAAAVRQLAARAPSASIVLQSTDDLFAYRRAERERRERRKQRRLRAAVAAVMVALAIVGGGFYWQSHQQKQTLTEIAALVDKYSLATPAQAAIPGAKQSLTQAITAIAEGAASDPRYAQALALLKAGKPNEAEPLLKAVAEDKEKRADKDAKDAAAAYRNLASIAAVSDPGRAREYYAQAARLDPSDVSGMFQNGWFQEQAGQLDAARAAYARVIAAAKPGADDEALVWAKFGMGDIAQQRGNLGAAGATYHEAETIADRLAKSDPGNAGWQRDLSVSYDNVGDVQVAQGNLPAALASYQASLAIRDRLAKSDPGNAGWQRDLSVSYNKVGDVQVAQGNLPAALASYQASLAIKRPAGEVRSRQRRLAARSVGVVRQCRRRAGGAGQSAGRADLLSGEPRHQRPRWRSPIPATPAGSAICRCRTTMSATCRWRRAICRPRWPPIRRASPSETGWRSPIPAMPAGSAICRCRTSRVGDVQVAQGNLPAALASYQAGLAIADRLAKSDPGNAGWQRDLSVSYDKVGDVQVAQGNLPAALTSYQAGLAIADRLAKSDPGNAGWQRDLSVSYDNVGDVQVAQGNLPAALTSYQASLAIRDRAGEVRSRQRRLAARSVGVVRQCRRRAGGAGQSAGRADLLSGEPRHRRPRWRSPIPATPAGSAICRCRTRESATCRWRRAICRPRWPPIRRASPSPTAWRSPIPAMPAGSAICRCRTTRSATCRWRRAICRPR